MNALLRYHYKVEVETLSDEEFIKLWNEYLFAKEMDKNKLLSVLRTVAGEIFGKDN